MIGSSRMLVPSLTVVVQRTESFLRSQRFVLTKRLQDAALDFQEILEAPVLLMGFAPPGANMHAPNEWIPESQVARWMRAMVRLYREIAATGQESTKTESTTQD